jgi:pimeloyl-ACP methyl ester carboxylesterase
MVAAPPRGHTVDVGGLALHYLAWGDADRPPVVLLHGGSAHAHWWDFVAPALANRLRLLAPDLRGHGESAHVAPPAYDIDDYVADLAGLAAALGLGRFALVGHSLGGVVALRYAERHPAAVRALALIDSRPVTGTGRGRLQRLSLFPHPVYADGEEAVRRFRLLPRGTSADPEILRHVALAGLRPTDDGRLTLKFDRNAFARRAYLDLGPALAALRCPCLLVRGTESVVVDAETFAGMGRRCPHATRVEIAGAHHHVVLDRPAEAAAALTRFLATAD